MYQTIARKCYNRKRAIYAAPVDGAYPYAQLRRKGITVLNQVLGALAGLGVIVITAIGYIVKAYTDKVLADIQHNTDITKQTREGLTDALERLAAARNTILGLREIIREREDRIAYLAARHPEIEDTIQQYQDRRQRRTTELDEREAEKRIIASIDNPPELDHSDGSAQSDQDNNAPID